MTTETLLERWVSGGTFHDFMELVLYDPDHGYYGSAQNIIGKDGDFFTSSSLGGDFGELIAEAWYRLWQTLDCPSSFTILEMGAGKGSFALDGLTFLARTYPQFFAAIDYAIAEKSPILKQQQHTALASFQGKVRWVHLDELPAQSLVGVAFSNELLDAFAVHRIQKQNGQLGEIYVHKEGHKLVETLGPLSSDRLTTYFQNLAIDFLDPIYPDGYTTEVNLQALDWLNTVQNKFSQGLIVTIDYGYTAAKYYHPQRHQGTLTCYFQHRNHHDPYVNLGQQDITAHVDFTTLEQEGHKLGLATLLSSQQALLLMGLGLGDRLNQLSLGHLTLPEILPRRDALHQLLNPQGLGGFTVLIQGKQLTAPQQTKFKELFPHG